MDMETVNLIVGKPNNCDLCYGEGVLYYGNEEDFTVEQCECKYIPTKKEGKTMSSLLGVREIRDPYEGRGLEFSINITKSYKVSMVISAGLTESLAHFDLSVSTPFDPHSINEGQERIPSWYKRIGLKTGALFTTFCLEFYITNTQREFGWMLED